ncbi:MAG: DUF4476 domain-containing protein [Alphaproteobacteria bacterium]|nr:DUF4476 domain-containing protein [Alphaproteobacteria bacterium]
MLPLLIALAAPADAAEILVRDAPHAQVWVDGAPAVRAGGVQVAPELAGGRHVVELRGPDRRLIAWTEVALPADARLTLSARDRALVTVKLETMALPVRLDPYPHGADLTTTVSYGYGYGVNPYPVRPAHHVPAPVVDCGPPMMSPGAFTALVRAIDDEPFSSDRLDLVRAIPGRYAITIHQLGQLLDTLTFSSEKIDAARMLRGSVVDPENAWRLNDHLTFSSEKREIQAMFREA